MPARVISLAERRARSEQPPLSAPRVPLALNVHIGAVELILGSPLDENATELWLSPEQAEELANDLLRTAKAAKAVRPR